MSVITNERDLQDALSFFRQCGTLVVDLETNGTRPWHGDRMCGIAIRGEYGDGILSVYLPFRHGSGTNLPLSRIPDVMALLNEADCQIGFNYKFDLQFLLQEEGFELPPVIEDVMLAAHLMNENEENFKLKDLGRKYISEDAADEQAELYRKLSAMGYTKKTGKDAAAGQMWRLTPEDVGPYAIQDVDLTWRLREFYRPHLEAWKLWVMYLEICDYQLITTKAEVRGLLVDVDLCRQYMEEADAMVPPMKAKLDEAAGYAINPRSSKQVCAWLGVESSRAEVLEEIAEDEDHPAHEACKVLLEYRAWAKVNDTYYRRYLEEVDRDCVLRPSLSLIGTISGRLSCRYPNLQAVPQYSEVYKVKDVFIARPGYVLVSADYSQAELRLACHYTQDENLMAAFANDEDIHQMTADLCGMKRTDAKRINFGILYGLGAPGLAANLGVPIHESQKLLRKYHAQFPGYRRLLNQAERTAEERGYIRMWTGRCRRYGPKIPTHKASSNLIQGGVAEMMRTTILKLDPWCTERDIHMLLQVHDQILFEVPEDKLHEYLPGIRDIMMDLPFTVPMKVDISYGPAWGKLTDWKETDSVVA